MHPPSPRMTTPSAAPIRVPEWVREAVLSASARPRARALAEAGYESATRLCLNLLARVTGVESVSLRGGILERCVPGVSDLDLTIRLGCGPALPDRRRTLLALRRRYAALKTLLWVPGEVIAGDASDFATAASAPTALARALGFPGGDSPAASRFSLVTTHYLRAIARLAGAADGASGLAIAVFRKEMGKALGHASGDSREDVGDAAAAPLLERAYHALDDLAGRAAAEARPAPDFALATATPWAGEDPVAAAWAERLARAWPRLSLHPSTVPRVIVVMGDPPTSGCFAQICQWTARSPVPPPILFSARAYAAFLALWGWGASGANAAPLRHWLDGNPRDRETCRDLARLGLAERTRLRAVTLPGKAVFEPAATLGAYLRNACGDAIELVGNPAALPRMAALWAADEPPRIASLVDAIVSVGPELVTASLARPDLPGSRSAARPSSGGRSGMG